VEFASEVGVSNVLYGFFYDVAGCFSDQVASVVDDCEVEAVGRQLATPSSRKQFFRLCRVDIVLVYVVDGLVVVG